MKLLTTALLLSGLSASHCLAQSASSSESDRAARQIVAAMNIVLDHHVTPPTLQQMVLTGLVGVAGTDAHESQPRLARAISRLSGREDMLKFLADELSRVPRTAGESWQDLERRFLASLLQSIARSPEAGATGYIPAKQLIVDQQIRDNRYVGIGIALGVAGSNPYINQAFPRGPAFEQGALQGDVIESIDQHVTSGMKIEDVIDRLRGPAGTTVSLLVRQPGAKETRTLNIVRREVPFDTVVGPRQDAQSQWEYAAEPGSDIAHVTIQSIRGSTSRELKETAMKLHALKFRGVILDLQGTDDGELRHAVMVADQLLGKATVGWLQRGENREEYTSDEDSLFAGWPMCVLVGPMTHGQAEWLAAALQDHNRARLVGMPTPGKGSISERFPLERGGAIVLTTGRLLRANGQPLVSDHTASNYHQAIMMTRLNARRPGARIIDHMPGMPPGPRKWEPGPGWHGVKPDVEASDPRAQAIADLKDRFEAAELKSRFTAPMPHP